MLACVRQLLERWLRQAFKRVRQLFKRWLRQLLRPVRQLFQRWFWQALRRVRQLLKRWPRQSHRNPTTCTGSAPTPTLSTSTCLPSAACVCVGRPCFQGSSPNARDDNTDVFHSRGHPRSFGTFLDEHRLRHRHHLFFFAFVFGVLGV